MADSPGVSFNLRSVVGREPGFIDDEPQSPTGTPHFRLGQFVGRSVIAPSFPDERSSTSRGIMGSQPENIAPSGTDSTTPNVAVFQTLQRPVDEARPISLDGDLEEVRQPSNGRPLAESRPLAEGRPWVSDGGRSPSIAPSIATSLGTSKLRYAGEYHGGQGSIGTYGYGGGRLASPAASTTADIARAVENIRATASVGPVRPASPEEAAAYRAIPTPKTDEVARELERLSHRSGSPHRRVETRKVSPVHVRSPRAVDRGIGVIGGPGTGNRVDSVTFGEFAETIGGGTRSGSPGDEDYLHRHGHGFGSDSDHEDEEDDPDAPGILDGLPPVPDNDAPVVPAELLKASAHNKPYEWDLHPCSPVVIALLTKRGVMPGQFGDIVEYHMAQGFLNCLLMVMSGAYFVRYAPRGTAPKDRWVILKMIPDEFGRATPYLCWFIHSGAVQMVDRVRLEDLVGITKDASCPNFRRHMLPFGMLRGSFVGQHRAKLSTRGAFSLWFFDRVRQRPRSLDLVTTNLNSWALWTKTMEGVLAVNSVCVNRTDVAQEMQRLFLMAQQAVAMENE